MPSKKDREYLNRWLPKVARAEVAFGDTCWGFDPDIALRKCGTIHSGIIDKVDELIILAHPELADDKKVVRDYRKRCKENLARAKVAMAKQEEIERLDARLDKEKVPAKWWALTRKRAKLLGYEMPAGEPKPE